MLLQATPQIMIVMEVMLVQGVQGRDDADEAWLSYAYCVESTQWQIALSHY
jgi:hypothetical protein